MVIERVRMADLRCKEVINIKSGYRLGYVCDVEMDIASGQILAIIVPGPSRFFWFFGREDDVVIKWEEIEKIGEDIILVCYDMPERIRVNRWFKNI